MEVAQQLTEEQLKMQAATVKGMFLEMREEMKKSINRELRAEYAASSGDEADSASKESKTSKERQHQKQEKKKAKHRPGIISPPRTMNS